VSAEEYLQGLRRVLAPAPLPAASTETPATALSRTIEREVLQFSLTADLDSAWGGGPFVVQLYPNGYFDRVRVNWLFARTGASESRADAGHEPIPMYTCRLFQGRALTTQRMSFVGGQFAHDTYLTYPLLGSIFPVDMGAQPSRYGGGGVFELSLTDQPVFLLLQADAAQYYVSTTGRQAVTVVLETAPDKG